MLVELIVVAGLLTPVAAASPGAAAQEKTQEKEKKQEGEKEKAKGDQPEKAKGGQEGKAAPERAAGGLEPADLDDLGALADEAAAAGLDDDATAELLADESRAKSGRGMRGARREGGGPEGGGPPREGLGPFVRGKMKEGVKGADLVAAIKAEREKRLKEFEVRETSKGISPEAKERMAAREKSSREAAVAAFKKAKGEGLKGRAFAEAFVREHRAKMDDMRKKAREADGDGKAKEPKEPTKEPGKEPGKEGTKDGGR